MSAARGGVRVCATHPSFDHQCEAGTAQNAPSAAPSAETRQQEQQDAFSAGFAAATVGAAEVALIDQGRLNLPAGFVFIPKAEGVGMVQAIGNSTEPDFLGLIVPQNDATWFATPDFKKAGCVKDDEAQNWNHDELLTALKDYRTHVAG